eukprot:6204497-Amphidinium_carterae.1
MVNKLPATTCIEANTYKNLSSNDPHQSYNSLELLCSPMGSDPLSNGHIPVLDFLAVVRLAGSQWLLAVEMSLLQRRQLVAAAWHARHRSFPCGVLGRGAGGRCKDPNADQ